MKKMVAHVTVREFQDKETIDHGSMIIPSRVQSRGWNKPAPSAQLLPGQATSGFAIQEL